MARKPGHDLLWKKYFSDPSQWWDNRNSKISPAHPDFKHKVTKESLWLDGWSNPPWVSDELKRLGLETPTEEEPDESTAFVSLLRACAKRKDLYGGTKLHNDILRRGLLGQCSDALVTMYAKCGALAKAKELFDMYKSRDVFTWTSIITGCVEKGQGQDALDHFEQMKHEGLYPDAVIYSCILKACGSIGASDKGGNIHDEIAKQGLLEDNVVLGTALVDMYAKCGVLAKAQQALKELSVRNVFSWTALMVGYMEHGGAPQVLKCFEQMRQEGIFPDEPAFMCILKACGTLGASEEGQKIHDEIAKKGLLAKNTVLGTALVDMYAKCGALGKAQAVLEELCIRDVVAWNALIAGYVDNGEGTEALNCFESMQCEGLSPDAVTFVCILKVCGSIGAANKGEQIHEDIAKQGLLAGDIVLGNALVDMYAKCGALSKAQQVLENLPVRDTITWNSLILGYAEKGKGAEALNCFDDMLCEGLLPDALTFICVLQACGSVEAADKGAKIHVKVAKSGLLWNNLLLGTALVDMYAKCGALVKAQQVHEEMPIQDAILWNSLIAGYAQQNECSQALKCFGQMQHKGLSPDSATFVSILKACASMGALDKGEEVHKEIVKQGLLADDTELGNALVHMYAKCGALSKARTELEELPARNVVSWNAILICYAENGESAQTLDCFEQMQCEGLSPDAATFSSLLSACSHLGLVEDGLRYFAIMSTMFGIKPSEEHYTCMIDLFGRAGHFDKALGVMEEMASAKNVVWCTLLGACWNWGSLQVARWAFEHAVQADKSDSAFYVLMAQTYVAAGMPHDAEDIEAMRIKNKAWKTPQTGWWLDLSENPLFSNGVNFRSFQNHNISQA